MSLLERLKQAALEMELFKLMDAHGDDYVLSASKKIHDVRDEERRENQARQRELVNSHAWPSKFSGYFGDAGGPL